MPDIQRINPDGLASPPGGRYAHVVTAGNLVWIAGQTSRGPDGTVIGKGDTLTQARQVNANLRTAIESAGGSLSDIVKVTIFLTPDADVEAARRAQNEYRDENAPPASFDGVRPCARASRLPHRGRGVRGRRSGVVSTGAPGPSCPDSSARPPNDRRGRQRAVAAQLSPLSAGSRPPPARLGLGEEAADGLVEGGRLLEIAGMAGLREDDEARTRGTVRRRKSDGSMHGSSSSPQTTSIGRSIRARSASRA